MVFRLAKEIELRDKFENMGAQMVKEVASKSSDSAGDGTTTATVLAQAIVKQGAKAVTSGMNPMDLKRGIDLAVDKVLNDLKSKAKKLGSSSEIAQVGTISANGEEEIGKKYLKLWIKLGVMELLRLRNQRLEIRLLKQQKVCNLTEVTFHLTS